MSRIYGLSLVAVFALAACGGGGGGSSGGGGGGGPDPADRAAIALDDTTSDEESTIAGAMLATPTSGPLEIRIVNAMLDHFPGDLEDLSIESAETGQALDPSPTGGWFNDTITITPNTTTPSSLIFSGIYNVTTAAGSGPLIIGVVAPNSVHPTSGSTVFTGRGFVNGAVLSDTTAVDSSGVSTITVNWTGNVDARIDGITDAPFDTITISGMTRSDASFAGGTILLLDGSVNETIRLMGNTRTDTASGAIYGALNDNSDAAEAGGVFITTGDSGLLGGSFIGNWSAHN